MLAEVKLALLLSSDSAALRRALIELHDVLTRTGHLARVLQLFRDRSSVRKSETPTFPRKGNDDPNQ